jgi:hypothetical protein
MEEIRRGLLAPLALVLLLPACRGPLDDFFPPEPQRTLVTQGSQSNIPPFATSSGTGFIVVVRFEGGTGTLEGNVDWTFASNPVAIGWGRGDCSQNPNCEVISQNVTTNQPKSVTAVNQQPGTYSLLIVNAGTTNESISWQIYLNR